MATEYTASLLENVRSHLLEVTGSSSSTAETTTPLPTLEEVVLNSGSGPFRCHKCKAALLLGPKSQICGACGTRREDVAASFRISFGSTLAYQLLMSSFQPQESVITGKSTPHTGAANLQTQQTEPKEGLVASDILNLELKWSEDEARSKQQPTSVMHTASANSPRELGVDLEDFFGSEDEARFKQQPTSVMHTASANSPRELGVDLEDFFGQSKPQDSPREVLTSTYQIQDVKWHAPSDSMPQVSSHESQIDLFSVHPGTQKTQTQTEDNDPFLSWEGDFKSANVMLDNLESRSLDTPAAPSAVDPFQLIHERKESAWNVGRHSTLDGKDLFGSAVSGAEHSMPMKESWIQDDPLSAIITKEPYIGSAENLEDNSGLQSDRPEAFPSSDIQVSFSGSIWQQGDIIQNNESTMERSRNHPKAEKEEEEGLDVLFVSHPASQTLKLDKENTSVGTNLTEIELFNRTESREVNAEANSDVASPKMSYVITDTPKGSSNDDSKYIVESLLSEMHDLSFMLADHLVVPDRNKEHTLCL